jgi:hypothetical protein
MLVKTAMVTQDKPVSGGTRPRHVLLCISESEVEAQKGRDEHDTLAASQPHKDAMQWYKVRVQYCSSALETQPIEEENNVIVEEWEIRPKMDIFSPYHISYHGIM